MTDLISLIVCTVGRTDALSRLLDSLQRQSDSAFEVIVVDQNEDTDIAPILHSYGDGLRLRHVRSRRGLSRARNVGLREAQGQVVGFPDDDCWYHADVIAQVRAFFASPEHGVLTGRTLDRDGYESVSPHRAESGLIDRYNVFSSGNSNTLFVRKVIATDVGGFDETLGVGSGTPFQSGEETDFLLRCLRAGYPAYYEHDFVVHHDQNSAGATAQAARARAYSQGFGRLLRLHGYGIGYLSAGVGRALVRGAVCLATGDMDGARRRYGWVRGSLRGYLARPMRGRAPAVSAFVPNARQSHDGLVG